MIGYWLFVLFFTAMLISCVILFIQSIKAAINTEDAHCIDPIPNRENMQD